VPPPSIDRGANVRRLIQEARDRVEARVADDLPAQVNAIMRGASRARAQRQARATAGGGPLESRLTRHESALDRLSREHDETRRQLDAMRTRSRDALDRLLRVAEGLDLRSRAIAVQSTRTAATARVARVRVARQTRELRSALVNARIERVSSVVTSTQRAAFGERGSVLAPNNLLLAGNELFWSFVGPTLRGLGLISETSATVAALLAPLGALTTGQLALEGRHQEPVVAGISTLTGGFPYRESLRRRVAPHVFRALERGPDLPVQITPIDNVDQNLRAVVEEGVLTISTSSTGLALISVPSAQGKRVAWMIDLGPVLG
jgi:hypothetical protein